MFQTRALLPSSRLSRIVTEVAPPSSAPPSTIAAVPPPSATARFPPSVERSIVTAPAPTSWIPPPRLVTKDVPPSACAIERFPVTRDSTSRSVPLAR